MSLGLSGNFNPNKPGSNPPSVLNLENNPVFYLGKMTFLLSKGLVARDMAEAGLGSKRAFFCRYTHTRAQAFFSLQEQGLHMPPRQDLKDFLIWLSPLTVPSQHPRCCCSLTDNTSGKRFREAGHWCSYSAVKTRDPSHRLGQPQLGSFLAVVPSCWSRPRDQVPQRHSYSM